MSLLDDVLDLFGWEPPPPQPKPSAPLEPKPAPAPKERRVPVSARVVEGRSPAAALAIVTPIAPQVRGVVYTRNRRIMASLADRGRVLRLNVALSPRQERMNSPLQHREVRLRGLHGRRLAVRSSQRGVEVRR